MSSSSDAAGEGPIDTSGTWARLLVLLGLRRPRAACGDDGFGGERRDRGRRARAHDFASERDDEPASECETDGDPAGAHADRYESTGDLVHEYERGRELSAAPFVVERSFADEVHRMLPPIPRAAAERDHGERDVASQMLPIAGAPGERDHRDGDAARRATPLLERPAATDPQASSPPARAGDGGRPFPSSDPERELVEHELAEREHAERDAGSVRGCDLVRRRASVKVERVVPITRLPLRGIAPEPTWSLDVRPPIDPSNVANRHRVLRACAEGSQCVDAALLGRAYVEEDAAGRALALLALRRVPGCAAKIAALRQALRLGTDEERAFALDALVRAGAREELAVALSDRVDAIAAQAALALAGPVDRRTLRATLAPHLDEIRTEAILRLLSGVIE